MKLQHLFACTERCSFVIDLTPEIAEDWLNHGNTHNRPILDTHVDYLASEMKARRWRLTHQGIAFSTNQVLLDGQHRLWAVVFSGVTVPMRVFVNEPPETMGVLDTGQRRRNDQILTLTAGLGEVSPSDLATLRAMLMGAGKQRRHSPGEEGALFARHREAIRFAIDTLKTGGKFRGVATAATRAVLARAWYSADRGLLRHFAEVLSTGRPVGEHDEPVLLLFQFLIGTPGSRNSAGRHECYRKTQRALSAFLRGEKLTRLYVAAEELFPLPEEAESAAA